MSWTYEQEYEFIKMHKNHLEWQNCGFVPPLLSTWTFLLHMNIKTWKKKGNYKKNLLHQIPTRTRTPANFFFNYSASHIILRSNSVTLVCTSGKFYFRTLSSAHETNSSVFATLKCQLSCRKDLVNEKFSSFQRWI